jgi:High potential iron-sulfur protein
MPALTGLLAGAALADSAKASQASMHYQTTPNGNSQCSGCKFFIPGQSADADGSCQIVDGVISPHGYCMAYNSQSS